ncbi:Predicted ATP-binding protein involved in virulence [Rosenbergiella nectarea]|uniref:Predicted ATP-binding protein involved in virulence n=1 Tax=Rosenbergiella nectarea TaxID=988801 RepID=A0A1H9JH72_9GAMM|nr:ATP-binding protein [Rosenbergiella nectarea]SEQ86129.1 Predicted ATP-binding protein involved in virulence [Rosenbergiella nectarea]
MPERIIIKSLYIEGFQDKRTIRLPLKDVSVFVGKNGVGKTTILRIIENILLNKPKLISAISCKKAILNLSNNQSITLSKISEKDIFTAINKSFSSDFKKIIKEVYEHDSVRTIPIDEESLKKMIFDKVQLHTTELIKSKIYEKGNKFITFSEEKTKQYISEIQVRYISTVMISANSEKEMSFGNSKTKNILDISMELELASLKDKGKQALTVFLKVINSLFSDTNKEMKYRSKKGFWVEISDSELSISDLSSGEKQLLFILATAANTIGGPAIFLMDEPEISLHLSWQEKIIDSVKSINPDIQLIIATHSPAIVMNGYMDSYIDMNSIDIEVNNE